MCLCIYIKFLYLFLGPFPSVSWFCPIPICFFWFYIILYIIFIFIHINIIYNIIYIHIYILSYYYPLGACLFLRKDRKRVDPDGTGGGEKVGGVGRENHNQDILYEKTSSFKFLKNC